MSNVYLVALLISNATGDVETIKAVDAVTQGGCTNMARQIHASSDPAPSGYKIKFTCGTREALEGAIAEHKCRAIESKDRKGAFAMNYECDPSLKGKLVGWFKSAL